MSKFAAIIVTYNPDPIILNSCISSIYEQVDLIVLVKNSSEHITFERLAQKKIKIIQLDKNYGIAYAQNRGIYFAIKEKIDFVLFSDQDTIYPEDYILKIQNKINNLGNKVVYAPIFFNINKKAVENISITISSSVKPTHDMYCVKHVISSGMVVSIYAFYEIGFFDEKLFIDYIDFEWCWRALYHGYKIIVCTDFMIKHNLGDSSKLIFGKKIIVRSNMRYFYMVRNGIYLVFHSDFLTMFERLLLFRRVMVHICGVFILSPSISTVRILLRAIYHGVKKKFIDL